MERFPADKEAFYQELRTKYRNRFSERAGQITLGEHQDNMHEFYREFGRRVQSFVANPQTKKRLEQAFEDYGLIKRCEAGVPPGGSLVNLSREGRTWLEKVRQLGERNYQAAKHDALKIKKKSKREAVFHRLEQHKKLWDGVFQAEAVILTNSALTDIKKNIARLRINPGLHQKLGEAVDHVFKRFLDEQETIWAEVEKMRGPESN